MSRRFYEALGPELAARAFADDGRDRTHHNEYGAYSLARMVIEGLRGSDPEAARRPCGRTSPPTPAASIPHTRTTRELRPR